MLSVHSSLLPADVPVIDRGGSSPGVGEVPKRGGGGGGGGGAGGGGGGG